MFILALWFFLLHLFRILQVKFTSQWLKSFLFHTTNCKHLYWRCAFTYTFYVCERWSLKFACFVRWYGPQIWAGTPLLLQSVCEWFFLPFFAKKIPCFFKRGGLSSRHRVQVKQKKKTFFRFFFFCVYICVSL